MTGYEKIAILLGELGNGASEAVLDRLKLSSEQMNKIKKAMKSVRGYGDKVYDPNDSTQVNRELAVLEEFKRYGELRGIYREVPHTGLLKTSEGTAQNVRNIASTDPEAMAKVLALWLGSDKK
ncbi:hypothetical protein [Treponema pectinovorum]|uniref:hypothetical protein n=1 Tax=Treponema pectinovorum TaxID=164 RepID=UPI0011CA245B|nr:hypothetical protein [Treponema pectinovorum]